jgi:anti-anti-sigma factor
MNIKTFNSRTGVLNINLSGEMDALGCTIVRPEFEHISTGGSQHIIMDITQVSFIDSSGIGAIVFLFKRLKEQQRSMEICGAGGQPQELLKLLRIDTAIPVSLAKDSDHSHSEQGDSEQAVSGQKKGMIKCSY